MNSISGSLTEKIQSLSADQIAEVEDFVELLRRHTPELARTAATASSPAFEAIWNNPNDAAYDAL